MSTYSYYLNIPTEKWDLYFKHIVTGIYGVKEGEYKVTRDYGGFRKIEFKIDPQIPLINSLPETIKNEEGIDHFQDQQLLERVQLVLTNTVKDYMRPGGTYYSEFTHLKVEKSDLSDIIKQLARREFITKFIQLSDYKYLIYINPYPVTVIVKIENNSLVNTIYGIVTTLTFDVDDGYGGLLASLNERWIQWKNNDDVTAIIHPPNIV